MPLIYVSFKLKLLKVLLFAEFQNKICDLVEFIFIRDGTNTSEKLMNLLQRSWAKEFTAICAPPPTPEIYRDQDLYLTTTLVLNYSSDWLIHKSSGSVWISLICFKASHQYNPSNSPSACFPSSRNNELRLWSHNAFGWTKSINSIKSIKLKLYKHTFI